MRDFCISAIFIILMLAAIAVNSVYVSKTGDELLAELDLAEQTLCIDDFESCWEAHKTALGISVNHEYIFNIDELLYSAKNDAGGEAFFDAVCRIRHGIEEIKRCETFSLERIL